MSIFSDLLKNVAKSGADDVAKQAAKNAAKSAAEDVAKQAAKNSAKSVVSDVAKQTAKTTTKNTAKYIIGGIAVTGAAAGLAAAGIESERKNNIDFTITKIEDASTLLNAEHPVKITYSPSEEITKKDTITITNSNSVPSIDGDYSVYSIINSSQLEILLNDKLVSNGTSGNMKMHTDFDNQLQLGAENVGETIGGVTGGAIGGVFNGLFPDGIPSTYIYIIIGVILCSSLLSIIYSIVF